MAGGWSVPCAWHIAQVGVGCWTVEWRKMEQVDGGLRPVGWVGEGQDGGPWRCGQTVGG